MHTDAEIDHLEELLSNIEVMPDAMCASELDSFLLVFFMPRTEYALRM